MGPGGAYGADAHEQEPIYFLQLWFNLSDPAAAEGLYDSAALRSFAGIDLGTEAAPEETTICKFRHLLEKHKLGKKLLVTMNEYPRRHGIKISNGTIVDATIISAPSSTKNQDGKRRPDNKPSSPESPFSKRPFVAKRSWEPSTSL